MAEEKINKGSIIDNDVFLGSKESAKAFKKELIQLEKHIKTLAVESTKYFTISIKTLADLEKRKSALQDITLLEKSNTEVLKQKSIVETALQKIEAENIRQKQELEKLKQQEIKTEKENISLKSKTEQEERKAIRSQKEFNDQRKEQIRAQFTTQKQTKDYKDELRSMGGILGDLIIKKKQLQDGLLSAKTKEEVKKINQELFKTNGQISKIKGDGVNAFNSWGNALQSFQFKFNALGQMFGQFAANTAMSLLSGLFGELTDKVMNLAKETFTLNSVYIANNSATDGVIIKNKELRDVYNEQLKAIRDLNLEQSVDDGNITGFSATIQKQFLEERDKINALKKEADKEAGEISTNISAGVIEAFLKEDYISNKIKEIERETAKTIAKIEQRGIKERQKLTREEAKRIIGENEKNAKKIQEENEKNAKKIQEENNKKYSEEIDEKRKILESFIKYEIEALTGKYGEEEKLIAKGAIEQKIILGIHREEELSAYNKLYADELEALDEKIKSANELYKKEGSEFIKSEIAKNKSLADRLKAQEDFSYKISALSIKDSKDARAIALNEKDELLRELDEKYTLAERKTKSYLTAKELIEKNYANKILGIKEEEKIKQIKIASDLTSEISKGLQDGLKERSDLQQQATQKEIDQQTRLIDIQQKLAEGGKDNVLAETEAKIDKLEAKKISDNKRSIQTKKALAMADIITKSLGQSLKDGKPTLASVGEALAASGIVSKVFEQLASGFYEGSEGLKESDGFKIGGGKDNILIRAHKGEKILGVEDSAKIPEGMTNKDIVKASIAYDNPNIKTSFYPEIKETQSVKEFNALQIERMTNEIIEVKKAIENKPVVNNNLERLGEWSREITESNVKTIQHNKLLQIKKPLQLHG